MQRENFIDLDCLVDAAKMPKSRGSNPPGDICVRRDCHRAPSPADALLEAARKEMRGRCDCEGKVAVLLSSGFMRCAASNWAIALSLSPLTL